ncbi:nucleoside-5'-triphosphate pyrophosphohydrolase MazG [Geotalea daltonii FRC-32]|uniref:Nucleoside triphosphate pyrophosphohydrolase n=1 Tax=Geotalea daltonii (strain DSM 22248 / JCM 15807 / FRC-32) TaxID=316067 RepID=B9M7E8_GEODF|nr:nucleoside triphosphate pyrophosphohydrolase [Geotalea daltonii]ACM20236.1 nucleoside-5'-triphosphate pyrophosphohydrolase MazG [Geotalea daltonii FRC-32]
MNEGKKGFDRLIEIMRRLRAPGGCPWDAEQTHESLKRYLVEECYEVLEAIDAKDPVNLKEELGDLMLQPVFHAAIAEECGEFTIDDVLDTVNEKLIRRHPHVFGDQIVKSADEQVANWERIKKAEKGEERKSALSGIPPHLPALMKAHKVTEKAARVGFDWEYTDQVFAKVLEELHEFQETLADGNQERMEAELGDLLFAIVNLGRFLSLDTEEALRKTINRFICRFNHIEDTLHASGVTMQEASLEEMDKLWEEAKRKERGEGKQ